MSGSNKFYIIAMLIVILGINGMGAFTYAITFLELEPEYKCTYLDAATGVTTVQKCDREIVCYSEDTSLVSYEIDDDSIYSLYNWNQRANLHCVKR